MSKKLVDRITLVSALSGALLAISVVFPLHADHTKEIPVTASHQQQTHTHG